MPDGLLSENISNSTLRNRMITRFGFGEDGKCDWPYRFGRYPLDRHRAVYELAPPERHKKIFKRQHGWRITHL